MKEKVVEEEFVLDGLHIAPAVLETIVTMSIASVEGVAALGGAKINTADTSTFVKQRSRTRKGVEVFVEDEQFVIDVHLTVIYGYNFKEVARDVRERVGAALASQIGITSIHSVNVYVDGIKFED